MHDYYTEERPWGWFKILYETPGYKVKEILVNPGARLSYQSHTKRSEHWLIVKGVATVTIEDKEFKVEARKSVDVTIGSKHRVANMEEGEMVFIEVQQGTYFGEDDIVRYEDDYNRR